MQALYASVRLGFRRDIVYGQKQTGQKLHDKKCECYAAETIKIIDSRGHRLVHYPPMPVRETQARIQVFENFHLQLYLHSDQHHAVLDPRRDAAQGGRRRSRDILPGQVIPSAVTGTDELPLFLTVINETSEVGTGGGKNRQFLVGRNNEHSRFPLPARSSVQEFAFLYAGPGNFLLRNQREKDELLAPLAEGREYFYTGEQEAQPEEREHAVESLLYEITSAGFHEILYYAGESMVSIVILDQDRA